MLTIVRSKKTEAFDAASLRALVARYDGVTVDVGAGDGRHVYRRALAEPGHFFIALDPVAENMAEMAAKAAKKPERGGAPNALFAVASVEHVPEELRGIADELTVTLPWGSLMRGIILGEAVVMDGLASLCAEDAGVRIVLNTRIFDEPVPLDARDLPEPTPAYARETMTPAFERHGLQVTEARTMDADEVAALGTTWAKRLSHRRPPPSLLIEATKGHS